MTRYFSLFMAVMVGLVLLVPPAQAASLRHNRSALGPKGRINYYNRGIPTGFMAVHPNGLYNRTLQRRVPVAPPASRQVWSPGPRQAYPGTIGQPQQSQLLIRTAPGHPSQYQ